MPDIYEQILNHPESWLIVARPDGNGGWTDPNAPIRLDEQSGTPSRPLLALVNSTALNHPSVAAAIALLENYVTHEGEQDVELSDPEHSAEVDAFLDAVVGTAPYQLASDYLRAEDPAQFPNAPSVRAWARQIWFETYDNHFGETDVDCAGFEHVFVGEVKDSNREIGGYHSWFKYWLDQQDGLVRYLRHDYRGLSASGVQSAREASVVMNWRVGGVVYNKPQGGFFVGDLPEMQIALGMVGLFDSLRGRYGGTGADGASRLTDRRALLGDFAIDLVLYPETIRKGQNGQPDVNGPHLRSLFAKFRGPASTVPQPDENRVPQSENNNAALRIMRALPNPAGEDTTGEFVELKNVTTQELDLTGWSVRDANQRAHNLSGTLAADATLRVEFDRSIPNSPMLGNSGGSILLFQGTQRLSSVHYGSANSGQIFTF